MTTTSVLLFFSKMHRCRNNVNITFLLNQKRRLVPYSVTLKELVAAFWELGPVGKSMKAMSKAEFRQAKRFPVEGEVCRPGYGVPIM